MTEDIYTQDGVNVDLGDLASQYAAKCCQDTYNNCSIAKVVDTSRGNFRGPRGIVLKNAPEGCIWSCAPDGIGTKVVLTDVARMHHFSALDMLAMQSFDLVRWGGMPIYMTSVLDVSSLGESSEDPTFKAVLALYDGFRSACHELSIIALNGETAELSSLVSSENPNATLNYNWGGSVHGLYHPDKMITGENIKEGDVVVTFKENGFRSNGISSVRKAFAKRFGSSWHIKTEALPYIKKAAEPSVLYDRVFVEANGWINETNIPINAIIHITGGSFESKLGKDILFPKDLSVELNDLWDLPDIMKDCANWREMSDKDLYKTWNGGQGALAILNMQDAIALINLAQEYGISAKIAGTVKKEQKPKIVIHSKYNEGEKVIFEG